MEYYQKSLNHKAQSGDTDPSDRTAATYNNMAMLYRDIGTRTTKKEMFEIQLELSEGKHNDKVFEALSELCFKYEDAKDYDNAIKYSHLGIKLANELHGSSINSDTAVYIHRIGQYTAKNGDIEKS